jgi:hypothetical protein
MGKQGELEWVEGGKIVRKNFEAIVVQYPSGLITAPQKFEGRLILATDTTERPLLVLTAGTTPSSLGGAKGWRGWPVSQTIINRRVGLFAWAVLLGAAIYKNLSHFLGW